MDIGTNWPWAGRMVLAICYGIGSSLRSKVVEGYRLALLHVLSQDVGVLGVFSDWPATTTFYANCMGLVLEEEDGEDPVVDHLRARLERLQRQRRWQTF
eukprot:scaffold12557_cov75-Cyclotella_meneghiniana.AAC.6